MSAATFNITVYKGANFRKTLSLTDADGNAFDLREYTDVRSELRRHSTIEEPAAIFACSILNDGSTGQIVWELSAEDTAVLPLHDHQYDMYIYKNDGTVNIILEGKVTVNANITK